VSEASKYLRVNPRHGAEVEAEVHHNDTRIDTL